jgi:phage-related protein
MVSSGGAANALASAMSKLAPSAQAFVREVIALKPAWHSLQLDVQQRLFLGLAGALASTATSVLPVLRANLVSSAGAMNAMGLGVLTAARNLASSGVLGQAMGSASAGLHNLVGIPGLVVTAFGQLAAAAGPTFQKLTASVASGAASIGASLGKAFASGGLQTAISDAVSLIKELISIGVNVGSILMSVFKATSASGGSFLDVLKTISSTLAKAFASPAVQSALKALFGVMNALATGAAPLLMQALGVIAPVLTTLGPPVQTLIAALGAGLSPIIAALGPVLLAAAQAIGQLLVAVAPLLPIAGRLIALLGPALTPIIQGIGTIFAQLAPLVAALGGALMTLLAPILAQLPTIITPLVLIIATLTGALLPVLTQLVVALSPSLGILAGTFAALLVAVAPLIQQLAVLIGRGLSVLVPVITPIIGIVGKLATILSGTLAKYITGVIIPAISALTAILQGHFSQALGYVRQAVSGWITFLAGVFMAVPAKIAAWMQPAITWMRNLPGTLLHQLGDVGSMLLGAGESLVKGFIHGIESSFDSVKNTLSNLTSLLPSWKGPPATDAKLLTANGRLVMRSFMAGIDNETPALHKQLGGLTAGLPGLTPGLLGRSGSVGGNVARSGGSAAASQPMHVHLSIGDKQLGEIVLDPIRKTVKSLGGNVQAALGVPGRG